jgi:hypothetical protein
MDRSKLDEQLRMSRLGVSLASDEQHKTDFHYDQVYTSKEEYLKQSYAVSVEPLVRNSIEGNSTLVIYGGAQTQKLTPYLFSTGPNTPMGCVALAADDLIHGHDQGVVRFSWFTLDNSEQEVITDILRAASTQSTGGLSKCRAIVELLNRSVFKRCCLFFCFFPNSLTGSNAYVQRRW